MRRGDGPSDSPDWSYYYCNGGSQYGDCKMPSISRERVDTAVLDYFAAVALNLDATRQQLESERDRRIKRKCRIFGSKRRQTCSASPSSSTGSAATTDAVSFPASDWQEFRNEINGERDALRAQVERLAESETEIVRDAAFDDAEQELLERLAEIRRSITGEINAADDVDAVRAAITRVFEGFVLHPQRGARYQGSGRAELVDVDDSYMVEFTVREDVLIDYLGADDYPNVRRVPLTLAAKTVRDGSPSR